MESLDDKENNYIFLIVWKGTTLKRKKQNDGSMLVPRKQDSQNQCFSFKQTTTPKSSWSTTKVSSCFPMIKVFKKSHVTINSVSRVSSSIIHWLQSPRPWQMMLLFNNILISIMDLYGKASDNWQLLYLCCLIQQLLSQLIMLCNFAFFPSKAENHCWESLQQNSIAC